MLPKPTTFLIWSLIWTAVPTVNAQPCPDFPLNSTLTVERIDGTCALTRTAEAEPGDILWIGFDWFQEEYPDSVAVSDLPKTWTSVDSLRIESGDGERRYTIGRKRLEELDLFEGVEFGISVEEAGSYRIAVFVLPESGSAGLSIGLIAGPKGMDQWSMRLPRLGERERVAELPVDVPDDVESFTFESRWLPEALDARLDVLLGTGDRRHYGTYSNGSVVIEVSEKGRALLQLRWHGDSFPWPHHFAAISRWKYSPESFENEEQACIQTEEICIEFGRPVPVSGPPPSAPPPPPPPPGGNR